MSKEAIKLALRSLRELVPDDSDHAPALQGQRMRQQKAITALREALAEQPAQQEPVKVKTCDTCQFGERCNQWSCKNHSLWKPVQPAQRKPLTDEQITAHWDKAGELRQTFIEFARAIEAAHGIKENT